MPSYDGSVSSDEKPVKHWKKTLVCALRGHQRRWPHRFGTPTWECERCGRTGTLDEASATPLGEHLMHAAVSALVLLLLVWILRRILR